MYEFKPSISEQNGLSLLGEKDKKILSIGISAGGAAEIEMARMNKDCHIIATTIDRAGLEFSKNIIDECGLSDRIELKLEDVSEKLQYKDKMFDFIYARLVFHYLDNQNLKNALLEMYRILKKEGKFFIVVRSIDDWEAKLEGTTYDEKTGMTTYTDIKTLGTEKIRYISRRLHSQETIKNALENVGFRINYIKEYEEYLYRDYKRIDKNSKPSKIIEVCVTK